VAEGVGRQAIESMERVGEARHAMAEGGAMQSTERDGRAGCTAAEEEGGRAMQLRERA
jgi:hypothetical protein